jgi:hypothetical protein
MCKVCSQKCVGCAVRNVRPEIYLVCGRKMTKCVMQGVPKCAFRSVRTVRENVRVSGRKCAAYDCAECIAFSSCEWLGVSKFISCTRGRYCWPGFQRVDVRR